MEVIIQDPQLGPVFFWWIWETRRSHRRSNGTPANACPAIAPGAWKTSQAC